MSTVIELLAEAHRVGLALSREPDDTLRIRGPRAADPIARQLLARKSDVLATVSVYNGQVALSRLAQGHDPRTASAMRAVRQANAAHRALRRPTMS